MKIIILLLSIVSFSASAADLYKVSCWMGGNKYPVVFDNVDVGFHKERFKVIRSNGDVIWVPVSRCIAEEVK